MSKKFKIGQLIGIFVGVTLGAITVSLISQALFGKSKDQDAYLETNQNYQYQYNQQPVQQGVFQQALSAPSNANQSRVY